MLETLGGELPAGSGGDLRGRRPRHTAQRICVWTGPVMMAIWIISFVFVAGFIPPPAPDTPMDQLVAMFEQNNTGIRVGLILTVFASALLVPWSAAVSIQIARAEGGRPVLAATQMLSGTALSLEFIVPLMVWQGAAYRLGPGRELILVTLNDLGWLMFVAVISSVVVQTLAVALAVLLDDRANPVFPRWLGYLAIWEAVLLAPAGLAPLFHAGPVAWNGLFAFWIPLGSFCGWMAVLTWQLLRAIRTEESG